MLGVRGVFLKVVAAVVVCVLHCLVIGKRDV